MKKIGIGAVALGAGVLLVLGGTGSTAYWQVVRETPAMELNTGLLDLSSNGERWTVNGNVVSPSQGMSERAFISNLRLVPGTTIVWEKEYFLDRVGVDLDVELDLDLGEIVGEGENAAAADQFVVTSQFSNDRLDEGELSVISFAHPSDLVTEVTGNGTFLLTVVLTWPLGDLPSNPDATGARLLNFEATSLTARQVLEQD